MRPRPPHYEIPVGDEQLPPDETFAHDRCCKCGHYLTSEDLYEGYCNYCADKRAGLTA